MARDDRYGEDTPESWQDPDLTDEQREKINYWSSDAAVAALNMERELHPDESDEALTKRIFREGAPGAAARIVRIALSSPTERTALDASKYIVDRTLGKVGDTGETEDPLTTFMKRVEEAANEGSGN